MTTRPLPRRRAQGAARPAPFTRRSFLRRLPLRSKVAGIALGIITLTAFAAPLLPLADPLTGDLANRLSSVGENGHMLGSDGQGRDILSRLVHAIRTSLIAGVLPVVFAAALGLAIGTIAGLAGRTTNTALMRSVDLLYAFPGVLLSLLLAISFGQGLVTLVFAITIVWIAPVARIAETEVLRVKDLDFVTVARASSAGPLSILLRQILPVTVPAVLAYATSLIGASIAIAGGLGFIGLGVPSPQPELGAMVQELQLQVYTDPLLALLPVTAILVLAVLFPVLGDGMRSALSGKEER